MSDSDAKYQERMIKLADEMRGSPVPVSAFFLVTSSEDIDLMVQRIRALSKIGVTTDKSMS